MARFASLFPSPEHAEHVYQALTAGQMAEVVNARIVGEDDWRVNWGLVEGKRAARRRSPSYFIDLWLTDEAVRYYLEELKKGAAVLVVEVPEEYSRQVVRLVKENHGQIQ